VVSLMHQPSSALCLPHLCKSASLNHWPVASAGEPDVMSLMQQPATLLIFLWTKAGGH
jgi:hypothetical protein